MIITDVCRATNVNYVADCNHLVVIAVIHGYSLGTCLTNISSRNTSIVMTTMAAIHGYKLVIIE